MEKTHGEKAGEHQQAKRDQVANADRAYNAGNYGQAVMGYASAAAHAIHQNIHQAKDTNARDSLGVSMVKITNDFLIYTAVVVRLAIILIHNRGVKLELPRRNVVTVVLLGFISALPRIKN